MSCDPHFGHCNAATGDTCSSAIRDRPPSLYRANLYSTKIACVLDIFPNKGYKHYLGSFLQALIQKSKRRAGILVVAILAIAYGWVFLRGPQGFQTLIEKRREIREWEIRNDDERRENERRKERIRRLQNSRSEQDMEIRKQLKLQKPGETTFILPESEQKQDEKAVAPPE
jgi:cell division protein FtsB